jgi:predicted  nucleic acid-binding Zn-ribbon protein
MNGPSDVIKEWFSSLLPILPFVAIVIGLFITFGIIQSLRHARGEARKTIPSLIALITTLSLIYMIFTSAMFNNTFFSCIIGFLFWMVLVLIWIWLNPAITRRHIPTKQGIPLNRETIVTVLLGAPLCTINLIIILTWLFGLSSIKQTLAIWIDYFSRLQAYGEAIGANEFINLSKEKWIGSAGAGILRFIAENPQVAVMIGSILFIASMAMAAAGVYEVLQSRPQYALPKEYDPMTYARSGLVLLGHEVRYKAVFPKWFVRPAEREERVRGEREEETIEIEIGKDGPYILNLENAVNPHCVVSGTSGSGKTQTVKAIIARYWRAKKIPALIIDWTGEYVDFVRRLGGIVLQVPTSFKLNPLALLGLNPSERAAATAEAVGYATDMTPLQRGEFQECIMDTYQKFGIVNGDESTYDKPAPTVRDVMEYMREKMEQGLYGKQERAWVPWILRRLQLLSSIFGEETVDFWSIIMRGPVCIDLSRLPRTEREETKTTVTYLILQRVYEKMRELSKLKLITVLDEAWQVLTIKTVEGQKVEPLPSKIVRLGRKYGFGILISTQMIKDVPESVLGNAATAIIHSFSEPHQLQYIKKFVILSDVQVQVMPVIPPGCGFVKQLGEKFPHLVQVQMLNDDELQGAPAKTYSLEGIVERPLWVEQPQASEMERKEEWYENLEEWYDNHLKETMIKCPSCGQQVPKVYDYCLSCGSLLRPFTEAEEVKEIKAPELEIPKPEIPSPAEPVKVEETKEIEMKPTLEEKIMNLLSKAVYTLNQLRLALQRDGYIIEEKRLWKKLYELRMVYRDEAGEPLIKTQEVPSPFPDRRRGSTYYHALPREQLMAESAFHRGLVREVFDYLSSLGFKVEFGPPKKADLYCSSLEATIEIETGEKGSLKKEDIPDLITKKKEHAIERGWRRVIIVVPSKRTEKLFARFTAEDPDIILTTVWKLPQTLQNLMKNMPENP